MDFNEAIEPAKFKRYYWEYLTNNASSTQDGTKADTSPPCLDTSFTTVELR